MLTALMRSMPRRASRYCHRHRGVAGSGEGGRTTRTTSSMARVSVYSGRERLGTVETVDDAFIAIDTDGTVIGTFPSQRQAADALEADNHS